MPFEYLMADVDFAGTSMRRHLACASQAKRCVSVSWTPEKKA